MKTTLFTRLAISSFLVTIKVGGKPAVDAHRIGEPPICSNLTDKDACNGAAPCVWKHRSSMGREAKCLAPDPPKPPICSNLRDKDACNGAAPCVWKHRSGMGGEAKCMAPGRPKPTIPVFVCGEHANRKECGGDTSCVWIPNAVGCRITKNGGRHSEKNCKDFKTNESCEGEMGCELIPRSIESGTCENKEMQVVSPQKE